jgi:hypothetical protein
MPSVFKKIIQGGAKIAEAAAPIVGGALGGPAGAMAGKAAAGGIERIASVKALGGPGFKPSSAKSITEARTQDKSRMQDQYGLGNNGG